MKRLLILLMAVVAAMPLYAQVGEKNLNRRYFNDVRDSLNNEMLWVVIITAVPICVT